MAHSLEQWLDYQQAVHPQAIALGLERLRAVAERLGPQLLRPAPLVITVAGTNGKGSAVAILRSILSYAGLRVGSYTSPHLLDYRERILLPEGMVGVDALVGAFERIEAARTDIPLTFFEFGTLAALLVFAAARLDVVILEVGLGGRLDAVNLVDADAALITTIDLDHQDWLGPDRESIGREKAGVLRPGQLAVYADPRPVRSVIAAAHRLDTTLLRPAADYRFWRAGKHWFLQIADEQWQLPWPDALAAPCQIHNLAACTALLLELRGRWPYSSAALMQGIAESRVPGRLQQLGENPELWLDIAHNPQAAGSLAQWLRQLPPKPTAAIFAALADKDVAGVVDQLRSVIDGWWLLGLDRETPRGLAAEALSLRLPADLPVNIVNDLPKALVLARQSVGVDGRVLVFGSFFLAALLLRQLNADITDVSFPPESK